MTIAVTRAAEGLDRRAFTVAAFERMAEFGIVGPDERLELIGGEIVPMAPKGPRNEEIRAMLNMRWGKACPRDHLFAPVTALRLDAMHYLEPDFIVFPRKTRLSDVKGPDVLLTVEVADFSLDYDLHRKPLIYGTFGVRELWVIDAISDQVYVHRSLRGGAYSEIRPCASDERLVPSLLPEVFAFALDDLAWGERPQGRRSDRES